MKKVFVALCASLLIAGTAFAAAPATTGEFGGHDAMGLAMGKQIQTDCKINWTDPKTSKEYCFSTEAMKKDWAKNTAMNTEKATKEYAKLSTEKTGKAMEHTAH